MQKGRLNNFKRKHKGIVNKVAIIRIKVNVREWVREKVEVTVV